jgi:hypothetical protein
MAELQCDREPTKVSLGFDHATAVNEHPSMTGDPIIHSVKAEHEQGIGAGAGQNAKEKEAALKTVAIACVDQSTHFHHACDQSLLTLTIAGRTRARPDQSGKGFYRHYVLQDPEQQIDGKELADHHEAGAETT